MARYDVVITSPAARDLQGIADYIAIDLKEPVTARRQLSRLRESILGLAEFPDRHALVADEALAAKGFRMTAVDNYLIFYIASPNEMTVTVIRVLYNRRDWSSILQIE